nr:hypothetical protein [Tanacetum cinerariifolium]
MKAYPKHIDWGKVIATNEIIDGYVLPKHGNKNLFEDDSWINIIMDDVYYTFYRDEEEEAKVAKASEDMKLFIMKYDKGKGKLVEDNGKGNETEHHHLKVTKDDKGKEKLVEDNGKRKLEEDFGWLLKAKKAKESKKAKKAREAKKARKDELAKQEKKAMEVELKEKEAKKANEEELKAKKDKEAILAKLKAKKAKKAKNAKEAMLAEVVQISNDEDDDKDLTAPTFTRSRAPTTSTSTSSGSSIASTSIRSRAPIASTSNAKAASTAPKGYKKEEVHLVDSSIFILCMLMVFGLPFAEFTLQMPNAHDIELQTANAK